MIEIHRLGIIPYQEMLEVQRAAQRVLIEEAGPEKVILCQHPPTITLGTSFHEENLFTSRNRLQDLNVDVVRVERGGDITFHGPGQIIVYPIIDLRKRKTDIGWYMRGLEQCVLDVLQENHVEGHRSEKNPGVWVEGKKIASCGVKLSRWCTMHGIALNVLPKSLEGFTHMQPCGLPGVEMACLQQFVQEIDLELVISSLLKNFLVTFGSTNSDT